MIRPAENWCFFPIARSTSNICKASSLVGVMIRAPNPSSSVHRSTNRRSSIGITNANVFPDPVFAAPRISLPRRAWGRVAA